MFMKKKDSVLDSTVYNNKARGKRANNTLFSLNACQILTYYLQSAKIELALTSKLTISPSKSDVDWTVVVTSNLLKPRTG